MSKQPDDEDHEDSSRKHTSSACCMGEFQLSNFTLNHPQPHLFVTSQWGSKYTILYVIWRVVWSIFFFVWIVLTGVHVDRTSSRKENHIKWFIYLTNWAFFFLNVNLLMHAVITVIDFIKKIKNQTNYDYQMEMPWYYKMMWVVYNVATGISLTMSAAYWGVVHGPDQLLDDINIITHGVNAAYIVLDILFVNGIPLRLYHVFHPMIAGAVYLIFTLIYDVSGGTNGLDKEYIYSVIDWTESPGWAVVYSLGVGIFGVLIMWLIAYALYRLRLLMYRCCCAQKTQKQGHSLQVIT